MPKKPKHKPNKNKGWDGLNLYDLGSTWDTSKRIQERNVTKDIARVERAEARRKKRALARRQSASQKTED